MKREQLDPYWHRSRLAARIWLKAQKGSLSARDRRVARALLSDKGVTNRLIEQGVAYWLAPYTLDRAGQQKLRVRNVVLSRN